MRALENTMSVTRLFAAAILFAFTTTMIVGCGPDTEGSSDSSATSDDHDHDHDHSHAHNGPHGGIPFDFEQSEYKGEWNHDNEHNIVRIYILEPDGKTSAKVAVESVTVTDNNGRETQTFELLAEDADEDGMATTFAKKSGPLMAAMPLGVVCEFELEGTTFNAKIEPHTHHDH